MIVYLCRLACVHGMVYFLRKAGEPFASRMELVPYEDLLQCRTLRLGTIIFADVERLAPSETEVLGRARDFFAARGVRVLNHPVHTMRRYELLRTLQELGVNQHGIHRLGEGHLPQRYPVFLRDENEHGRLETELIADEAALRAALDRRRKSCVIRGSLVAVEFEDTRDGAGWYRKYAAFRVGDAVIPRHVFFSRRWMVRHSDAMTAEQLREERRYLEINPHETELRRVFELARVDYGRIDYSVKDGRIVVWEINSHPTILWRDTKDDPQRAPHHAMFLERFAQAMMAVDSAADTPLRLPATLRETFGPPSTRGALRRSVDYGAGAFHRLLRAIVPMGIRQRLAARARRR